MESEDTDILIAMLTSLLDPPHPEQSVLLDQLVACDGDVERAASAIKLKSSASTSSLAGPSTTTARRINSKPPSSKRKRPVDMDEWLGSSLASKQKLIPESKLWSSSKQKSTPPSVSASPTRDSTTSTPGGPLALCRSTALSRPPISLPTKAISPSSSKPISSSSKPISTSKPAVDEEGSKEPSGLRRSTVPSRPPISLPTPTKPVSSSKPKSSSSSSKPISSSSPKTPVDLMKLLQQAPTSPKSKKSKPIAPRPLTLPTPSLVAQHTPCTLHLHVLPPDLACELFYTMLDESRSWSKNKWWLFDRVVESPHRTSFYARRQDGVDGDEGWQEAAQYWYNGRKTTSPPHFPSPMEHACAYIEDVVNAELAKRPRYPLEWGGRGPEGQAWRANVAASNCYEGAKEGVGFHSDQLTYLGPYPTIASLSLGTTRTFRLREVIPKSEADERHAQTFNIPVPHNSLTIMHASCQERFKHTIPTQSTPLDMFHPPFPRSAFPHSASPPLSTPASEPASHSESATTTTSASMSQPQREPISQSAPSSATTQGKPQPTEPEPSNVRINITFRFYRPDFRPHLTPRCKCDVPCILRPDMKNRTSHSNSKPSSHPTPTSKSGSSSSSNSNKNGNITTTETSAGATTEDSAIPDEGAIIEDTMKYWWTCYAGAQNDGKGCNFWKVMDVRAEGRGPFAGDLPSSSAG